MIRGKYIVIEGPEGVGKTTQLQELSRKIRAAGLPVRLLREPDSQSDLTARAIRQLTQDPHYPMNTNTEVLLYNAARSQSLQVISRSIESGVICLVDRNYLTTLAIQYYGRGDVPDYDTINNIINFAVNGVQPDLCIVLDAPASVLHERIIERGSGERFDKLDQGFLERVRAGYLWEAHQRNLPIVFATDTVENIGNEIWKLVSKVLAIRQPVKVSLAVEPTSIKQILADKQPLPTQNQPHSDEPRLGAIGYPTHTQEQPLNTLANSNTTHDYLNKDDLGRTKPSEAGRIYLADIVTDATGNVYAFKDKLSPMTVAAAMARLSRRGDDMRVTLLDEFVDQVGKDEKLLERVITAYGDDSVQQLAGLQLVVENASNLLTKKLEWGRLAAYLEQSTRYIYFDTKDDSGRYRYHIPSHFPDDIKDEYIRSMDQIFEIYSEMVKRVTGYVRNISKEPKEKRDGAWMAATRAQACDAARAVLPVATTSTVGIFASGQALESLIMHLQSDALLEANHVGDDLLAQARQVMPVFFQRADKPERGGAMVAYRANTMEAMAKLAKEHLPKAHGSDDPKDVTLIDYWPKNELILTADMLYENSNISLEQLQSITSSWSYKRKVEIFNSYMGERLNRRHRPGRALEKAHYSWDIVCDYGIFRDLQRHRMVDDLMWQELTPRYGYETPKLIEDAGESEAFDKCFDLSLKLHSFLQSSGYRLEAQYATLLGHKMRWKVTYNAREAFHLHELRTSPQGHPGYRKLVLAMHEKLCEVHPLIGAAMKFVNTDEDPELTRLAAERYTQLKLARDRLA